MKLTLSGHVLGHELGHVLGLVFRHVLGLGLAVSALWASTVMAQGLPPDRLPRQEPTPANKPRTGIGFGGITLSIDLSPKKKAPISQSALEMRDDNIPDYLPDQVIFMLQGNATDVARVAGAARVTVIEATWLDQANITMVVASLAGGDTPSASSVRLATVPGVLWAQPNHQFQLLGRTLPRRFALHKIPENPTTVSGKIVMIDAPVDLAHDNLVGARVTQSLFGVVDVPALHGTAVAALLVGTGTYPGTSQGAQLTSLAAFGPNASGTQLSRTAYLARAMNEASRLQPDVLNLSFGGPEDRLLSVLLDAIHKNGICVCAAAGNGGPGGKVLFPATHPSSLAVTAVDERLNAYIHASQGSRVDIAGVGVGLSAAVPGGRRAVSGTSFAAAVISGALLRMPACSGARSPDVMKQQVTAYAQDLGVSGHDMIYGAGLFRLTPTTARR